MAMAADNTRAYKFNAESIVPIYKLLVLIYYTLETSYLYINPTNIKKLSTKFIRELGKYSKRSKYT